MTIGPGFSLSATDLKKKTISLRQHDGGFAEGGCICLRSQHFAGPESKDMDFAVHFAVTNL